MGTVGQIVGTIIGVVIGFYTGGAGWALVGSVMMGAAAGYAAGSALDPTQADIPSPGQSSTGKLDVTLADEGVVIADALGTVKSLGNLFWYGKNRVVELTQEVEGGKGGGSSTTQKTGEEYYLSWAQGICIGPIDELISIFKWDTPVWQGNIKREDSPSGVTAIALAGMGTMYLYFGGTDQNANSKLGAILGSNYNPSYRGLCWVYFDDCLIGSYNRCPTMKFVFRKTPEYSWSTDNRIGEYDYNPAHLIYYLIDIATEIPASLLDEESFSETATTLGLEGRGISMLMGEERQAQTYLENALTHIGGILQFEADGKFHLGLMRSNVEIDDMASFGENDFTDEPTINRNTWLTTINDVRVQYAARVDRPFKAPVDPIGNPDVYVMAFIDEAWTLHGAADWSQYETEWEDRGYCDTDGDATPPYLTLYGDPTPKFLYDINKYFPGGVEATKEWLLEGSYHNTALIHITTIGDQWSPISPVGYSQLNYCDQYVQGTLSGWSVNMEAWQLMFENMIASGRGRYVPGSVLRIYLDTSSMGGISVLEPGYSEFKSWVQETYGGLLYLEYEHVGEFWIQMLHEDLTPWGYGGGA